MPDSILANTACKVGSKVTAIAATCERMAREQIPNLLRLYLNPHVAQACYCLTRHIAEAWPAAAAHDYQVFLANSSEEALSGAIKLARYAANEAGGSPTGMIIDEQGDFEHFAHTELRGHGRLEFIPGIEVLRDRAAAIDLLRRQPASWGFVAVSRELYRSIRDLVVEPGVARRDGGRRPIWIVRANHDEFGMDDCPSTHPPDIVTFDESFVNGEVPFGAFAATKRLFQHWNRRGMSTFHSTTFQPNTISTLHLMNCLEKFHPDFVARHQAALRRIDSDPKFRHAIYRDLYSRSLARLAGAVGGDQDPVRAAGHYFWARGARIFDAVAGVACSLRGHNPATYVDELLHSGDFEACRTELSERLFELTGLPRMVPAVSGASAVEHALRIGLASQFPRDYVLALRGGFGGKTLLALTGTSKESLKRRLAPLYSKVVYVDPFAPDAVAALEAAFREYPIGVIQLELVQGVGGVRALPDKVLRRLVDLRGSFDCLLFVDEIQTGMFRTGPFLRAQACGLEPDLLTIGKGTSDMMFPFAMTLFSDGVQRKLDERECRIPEAIAARQTYETGVRTVLNSLRRADSEGLSARVCARAERFDRLLRASLAGCRRVRGVRSFGLLIGIELDVSGLPRQWLKSLVGQLYLAALLNAREFPLLAGFCQYEPHVLKLTPPLSVTDDELDQICGTISLVLRRPLLNVAFEGLLNMVVRPTLARAGRRFRKVDRR